VSAAHSRHYAPYLGRIRPFPGAADLLRAIARRGLDVVLATSAKADEVDLMLAALGAGSAVSAVVSSGDVDRAKPDPGIVHKALDESGIDPERAVMVGDAIWDVIAAERAGIRCIGLLCGGAAAEQLFGAGAADVYPDPAALLGDIHASPIGQLGTRPALR
jgi:phosphoglycolate phosphatase-like HAD superfamily hydrolase